MPPISSSLFFFFNDTATTEIYTLSLHDALPILLGDGIEDTDRQSPWQASGELPRAEDSREGGRCGVGVGARQLGCPADAPAVDQAFAAAVHLAAVDVELEQAPARDEERTLLGEERLEGAQVQDAGIGLH